MLLDKVHPVGGGGLVPHASCTCSHQEVCLALPCMPFFLPWAPCAPAWHPHGALCAPAWHPEGALQVTRCHPPIPPAPSRLPRMPARVWGRVVLVLGPRATAASPQAEETTPHTTKGNPMPNTVLLRMWVAAGAVQRATRTQCDTYRGSTPLASVGLQALYPRRRRGVLANSTWAHSTPWGAPRCSPNPNTP